MACVAHFEGTTDENMLKLTAQTCSNLIHCLEKWRKLFKEPEKTVSRDVCIPLLSPGTTHIHKACYQRITNKSKLEMAARRYKEVSKLYEHSFPGYIIH